MAETEPTGLVFSDDDDGVIVNLLDEIAINSDLGTHRLYDIGSVIGSDGDDVIDADHGQNVIDGEDGDDTIPGHNLPGHNGNDTLRGGDDEDQVRGGPGNDFLFGAPGDDHPRGEQGNDIIDGGTGEDTLFFGARARRLLDPAGRIRGRDCDRPRVRRA